MGLPIEENLSGLCCSMFSLFRSPQLSFCKKNKRNLIVFHILAILLYFPHFTTLGQCLLGILRCCHCYEVTHRGRCHLHWQRHRRQSVWNSDVSVLPLLAATEGSAWLDTTCFQHRIAPALEPEQPLAHVGEIWERVRLELKWIR